ncbi:MAG: VPLPA-CTERM sorting domain-containing protein [bacterium]|jgi:hypothetical protein|nr:VPLPA-CTERM sorting domain-containing protein [Betaproteobacteria bacterium]
MKMIKGMLFAGLLATSSIAAAQPFAQLGAGNVGITSFNFTVVGTTITLNEKWEGSGPGSILFRGLEAGVNYTVIKNITNMTGSSWTSFANELLPPGNGVPGQPGFIPAGFQPSNDDDGLSFAQGSGLPRNSSIFTSLAVDELAGRDYLDFSGAPWADGVNGTITFGLRDNDASNQPFLLFQRPNEFTSVVPVPAALPLLLSGLGIFGFLARRRNQA